MARNPRWLSTKTPPRPRRSCYYADEFLKNGAVLDSTPVTKPLVHAEMVTNLVNPSRKLIVANDDNYALAA